MQFYSGKSCRKMCWIKSAYNNFESNNQWIPTEKGFNGNKCAEWLIAKNNKTQQIYWISIKKKLKKTKSNSLQKHLAWTTQIIVKL